VGREEDVLFPGKKDIAVLLGGGGVWIWPYFNGSFVGGGDVGQTKKSGAEILTRVPMEEGEGPSGKMKLQKIGGRGTLKQSYGTSHGGGGGEQN